MNNMKRNVAKSVVGSLIVIDHGGNFGLVRWSPDRIDCPISLCKFLEFKVFCPKSTCSDFCLSGFLSDLSPSSESCPQEETGYRAVQRVQEVIT